VGPKKDPWSSRTPDLQIVSATEGQKERVGWGGGGHCGGVGEIRLKEVPGSFPRAFMAEMKGKDLPGKKTTNLRFFKGL